MESVVADLGPQVVMLMLLSAAVCCLVKEFKSENASDPNEERTTQRDSV
jgi:hypothetical protein